MMKSMLFIICFLSSCTVNKELDMAIDVSDIRRAVTLQKAIEEDAIFFIKRRMQNQLYDKEVKQKCEIVLDENDFIFYGYPYVIGEKVYVDSLFKTNKKEVELLFPAYKNTQGYHVKKLVYDSVLRERLPTASMTINYDLKYDIEVKNTLDVRVTAFFKSDFLKRKEIKMKVSIDKKTFQIISIENL